MLLFCQLELRVPLIRTNSLEKIEKVSRALRMLLDDDMCTRSALISVASTLSLLVIILYEEDDCHLHSLTLS